MASWIVIAQKDYVDNHAQPALFILILMFITSVRFILNSLLTCTRHAFLLPNQPRLSSLFVCFFCFVFALRHNPKSGGHFFPFPRLLLPSSTMPVRLTAVQCSAMQCSAVQDAAARMPPLAPLFALPLVADSLRALAAITLVTPSLTPSLSCLSYAVLSRSSSGRSITTFSTLRPSLRPVSTS